MPCRPLARRSARALAPARRSLRRQAAALLALAPLALGACGSSGPLSTLSSNSTPQTVLQCVREVATEQGLPVIEQLEARTDSAAPAPMLRAQSAPLAAGNQAIDVLTVSFAKIGRGLRVAAQTLRPRASGRGAAGALWQADAPSPHLAEARDVVLARCGSLGR